MHADDATPPNVRRLRSIAFYLPQYHPIPENDEWWGRGFTEWTNVVRATPSFRGHYQPHLPADLGFYDLRVPESRLLQAELAQQHGIDAFCYYHYWFSGRRLLERPFNEVLRSREPSFPFVLCWANENWTRVWDGGPREVLLAQTYSEADDLNHIHWLSEAFADNRYLRVTGRPVFLVYRSSAIPDVRRTIDTWRSEADRLGIGDLYLIRVESYLEPVADPQKLGFDAAVEFQPDPRMMGPRIRPPKPVRVLRRLSGRHSGFTRHFVHEYSDLVDASISRSRPTYKRYPCVTPSWDNSPRRQVGALILTNSTPSEYRRWLCATVERFSPYSEEENFVFVNAWNEWAEGNHLEPCLRFGREYLAVHLAACGRSEPSRSVVRRRGT